MDGLAAMKLQDWEGAKASFNAVYQQVPGELAPKLALAVACERGGLPDVAEGLYATCAATDAAYVAPASFGMARVRAQRQDAAGAVAALDQVPKTSRGYPESRQLRAEVLLAGSGSDLARPRPGDGQHRVGADGRDHPPAATPSGSSSTRSSVVQGRPERRAATAPRSARYDATEVGICATVSRRAYRALARDAPDLDDRIELVNQANAVRTWTLT